MGIREKLGMLVKNSVKGLENGSDSHTVFKCGNTINWESQTRTQLGNNNF